MAASPLQVQVGAGPESPLSARASSGLFTATPWRYALTEGPYAEDVVRAPLQDFDVPITAGTTLRYAVHAEFGGNDAHAAGGHGATAVAVDLVLDDGSRLSDHRLLDHHGFVAEVGAQAASKSVVTEQWTAKQVDLSALAGRRVLSAEVVVQPQASALDDRPALGWIDGLEVSAEAATDTTGRSPAEWVLTTRGTHASARFSRGNNAPLTTVPHGAAFAIPLTDAGTNRWPYAWCEHDVEPGVSALQGFAVSHIASPWMADRSVVQLAPGGTQPVLDRAARARTFRHGQETAHPHLYAVTFDDGTTAELTATSHALLLRLTLRPDETVIADAVDEHGALAWDVDDDRRGVLTGYVDGPWARGERPLRMYVWARTDVPVTDHGRFADSERAAVACWIRPAEPTVTVVLATSFISLDQARRNADLEVGDASFDDVVARSKAEWDALLGRVHVEGASADQRTSLYSDLYRLFAYPNDAAENTGSASEPHWQHASFLTEPEREHTPTETGADLLDGQISVNHGFWDTYRTAWPLLALLAPERTAALADGFVTHYRDGGWTPRWSAPGYCDCMVGTSSDIVFADALAAGAEGFDLEGAFDSALRNATVPARDPHVGRKGLDVGVFTGVTDTATDEGLSWAMDNALNDYGVARLAEMVMAREPDHERREELSACTVYFTGRAAAYANHFDPATQFFQGVDPDGGFRHSPESFDPRVWGIDYTETNAWGMRFTVPHDGEGLAALFGGRAELEQALDEFFAEPETAREQFRGAYGHVIHEMTEARNVRLGMLGLSNQPAHHIPYMYLYAGAPAKAQAILRECVDRLFLGSEIGQGYPGDEDNGEMSAWYVFAVLGLYPLVPGSGRYVITAPRFDVMTVEVGGGRRLTVRATRTSPAAAYVQGVRVDGEPWTSTSIDIARLRAGAVLEVELGDEPGSWGTAAEDVPPSLTAPGSQPAPWRDLTAGDHDHPDPAVRTLVADRSDRTVELDADQVVELSGDAERRVEVYTLTSGPVGSVTAWRLEGADADGSWQTLDRRTEETFRWDRQTRPFLLAEPALCTRYRLVAETSGTLLQVELLTRG